MGEFAVVDFTNGSGGVRRHLESNEPLLLLYEERGLRVFQKPLNMHLLSTVGLSGEWRGSARFAPRMPSSK